MRQAAEKIEADDPDRFTIGMMSLQGLWRSAVLDHFCSDKLGRWFTVGWKLRIG
jgi:hypothetical protein